MKHFLRSLCTLLLLMMWCSVGIAQNKVSVSTLAKSAVDTKTTGDCDAIWSYNEALALQNKGAQFNKFNGDLNVSLSEKNAVITKIVINAAQSGTIGTDNKTISIKVGGKSFGSNITLSTKNSKDYLFEGESSGNIVITLGSSTNNASIYIKTVSFTYHLGSSKTPTTLTFPKPIFNIEEGNEATFTGQTATLTVGETVLNNAITYTTNNDAMFEAYEANVGPKALKVGAYGTAVVTATFAGDDTYAASTATYTVNYTEKAKPATTLDFGFATKTVNINETFIATAALKAGETAISGAVTYTSSKPEVATVNETTGEVLALAAGKAKITATFAGTSEYKSSTAFYDLTVVDPNATEVTFDFSKPGEYGLEVPKANNGTEIGEGNSIVSGIVSLTVTKESESSSAKSRFWNSNGEITYRLYKGAINTVSVPQGYVITAISITDNDNGKNKLVTIGENKDNSDWTGSAQSVIITGTDKAVLETMTVAYSKLSTLTLDEAADDTDTKIANNNGKTVDITLTRTLTAGKWNTICLPFDVTAEQIASVLKSAGNVKEYGSEEASKQTIYFKDAETMVAGKPYLIKPTESATELVFKGVTIKNVGESDRKFGSSYKICGTFGKYTMKTDGTELFLKTDGKFYVPAKDKETMKGFRAYFIAPKSTAGAALNLSFGEATGIDGVAADAEKNVKVYNVNGQYVGTSLDALPKGLYIVGGKKVLK